MINKKIFLSILLSCLLPNLFSGVIGASRWSKDDKSVCVYFDNHEVVVPGHFEVLYERVLRQPRREKPLTVLIENYCYAEHAELVAAVDAILFPDRFLEQFNPHVGREFGNGVKVETIEVRQLPYLLDFCFQAMLSFRPGQQPVVPISMRLFRRICTALERVNLTKIQSEVERLFSRYLDSSDGVLNEIFTNFEPESP